MGSIETNTETSGDAAQAGVRRSVLDSGLTVVTEHVPHVRTVALSVIALSGSRDETSAQNGLAHFLEHFVFRGTEASRGRPARSAFEIAAESDALGGELDAWTDREATGYSIEVDAELLPRALALVADLVARPALPASELERERAVITEELRGLEDSPEDVALDLSAALHWGDHPLGRPVAGTPESVASFDRATLRDAWERTHVPGNLLACAAGRLDHSELVAALSAALDGLPVGEPQRGPAAPTPARRVSLVRRDQLEQAQVVLSIPGLSEGDPADTTLDVLSCALGGGLSSRLWQRIREREGLAYDLSLGAVSWRDCGRLVLHAACAAENVPRVLAIAQEELDVARRGALSHEEIGRAVECLRSGLVLGHESPAARVGELAHWQVVHGRHVGLQEQLRWLDRVEPAGVHELAERLLGDPRRTLAVVGPEDVADLDEGAQGP